MSLHKIVNDPLYGLVRINDPFILKVLNHPFLQRLRRLSQMGLTFFVYPGATHNRLHHSLGAYNLMQKAIAELRHKGQIITPKEEQACLLAILLHDVGHGPFSHALERQILPHSHEEISLGFMHLLNQEFKGKLDLTIDVFKGNYSKKFLYQLISSQMDVDRMDYLARDSFYTGVVEGSVGYDRLLNLIHVHQGELVLEEKGANSIENFLFARYFMYRQVYYHKTALVAEEMLLKALQHIKQYVLSSQNKNGYPKMLYTIWKHHPNEHSGTLNKETLQLFSKIDDTDIWQCLKIAAQEEKGLIGLLTKHILERKMFAVESVEKRDAKRLVDQKQEKLLKIFPHFSDEERQALAFVKEINIRLYHSTSQPIKILKKDGKIISLDDYSGNLIKKEISRKEKNSKQAFTKYYFCYIRK